MTTLPLHRLLLTAAIGVAPLLPQSPALVAPPEPSAPVALPWPDAVRTDIVDGTPWAAADRWKASFTAAGATFFPFLGSDAPGCSATFGLRAVRCADDVLPLASAEPILAGHEVRYERGAVRERFALATQGIEHSFVFEALPVRGALQLDVAVTTDLTIAADANGHTLLGDHGGVRYGFATAIDARGRSCGLTTQLVDGALRIDVPAAFVASATLPLVVDPLIGTISTLTTPSAKALSNTDIAYDHSLHQFFVVYERAFSLADHDVYLVYCDDAMASPGVVTIDLTTSYWARPRIATLEAHDTACIVAQVSTGNVAPFTVKSRIVLGGPTPLVQPVVQLTSGIYDYLEPDVGGDKNPIGPSRFLVAYECRSPTLSDDYLRIQLLDQLGNVVATDNSLVSVTGRQQRPAIAKSCGTIGGGSEGWGLLYRYSGFQQSIGELHFAYVTRAGTLQPQSGGGSWTTVSPVTANADSEWEISSPTIDALGRGSMCVETRIDQATGEGSVFGRVIDRHGVALVPETTLASTYDYRMAAVDCDDHHFTLAYVSLWTTSSHYTRVTSWARLGNTLRLGAQASVTPFNHITSQPTICAVAGVPDGYALAWSDLDAANWTIQAQRYDGPVSGLVSTRSTGCVSVGGGLNGNPSIGGSFTASFGIASGIAAVLAGAPVAIPIGPCPGCTLGVDGSLFVGNELQVDVPLQPSLVGAAISFQGVQIDGDANSCLGLFRLTFTWDVVVL